MSLRSIACSALTVFVMASPALSAGQAAPAAQRPAAQAEMSAQELYHVHFVKAAPGKMAELISAYHQSPVAEGEPGPPLVFRHLQGDDWDLLVLTPMGKEETLSTNTSAEQQQWTQRARGLRAQHGDTFTSGPPWADLRTKLVREPSPQPTGTSGTSAGKAATNGSIYTVTTYRSLPGHRDQLADTLRRIAAVVPDRRIVLQHVEGAPWEFVMLSRYDDWASLGEDERAPADSLRQQGFADNEAVGTELRQHVAEHRDTIVRLTAGTGGSR